MRVDGLRHELDCLLQPGQCLGVVFHIVPGSAQFQVRQREAGLLLEHLLQSRNGILITSLVHREQSLVQKICHLDFFFWVGASLLLLRLRFADARDHVAQRLQLLGLVLIHRGLCCCGAAGLAAEFLKLIFAAD